MTLDSTPDLALPGLIDRLTRPATTLQESWQLSSELEAAARGLLDAGRQQDAIRLGLSVADAHGLDAYMLDACANVLQWSTWQVYDAFVAQRALELAERGRFAFSFAAADLIRPRKYVPFFVGAFMPKSGGTYISNTIARTFEYLTNVYFIFGGDVDNMISPARASVLAVTGGVHNHTHLSPSAWNMAVLRELRLPVWIHIRDPRDAFLSLVHMTEEEGKRGGLEAEAFYASLDTHVGPLQEASPLAERAQQLYSGFEFYCEWVSRWLSYDLGPKLVTQHADLARDEPAFFRAAAAALGIDPAPLDTPPKTYADARFFKGTNGRWKAEFPAPMIDRMGETMARHRLLDVFAAV